MSTAEVSRVPHVSEVLPVRRIDASDIRAALRSGIDDFRQHPSHYAFLALVYPFMGVMLGLFTAGANAFPLIYPLAAGFALLGPVAALGFYEISRRAERGEDAHWRQARGVLHHRSLPAILRVALVLVALFVAWMIVAQLLYVAFRPADVSAGVGAFLHGLFTTREGWMLIVLGNLAGFCFAALAFVLSAVALPLLLDRDVGARTAMRTSIAAVAANPGPMALWGLTVAVLLALGSLPLLVGLAVVVPVLGHATWHLYRRIVVAD